MMDLLRTPPRPTNPAEAAIWDDVFGTDETDLQYFQRRKRELLEKPVEPVYGFDPDFGNETFGDLEALWFCAAVSGGKPQGLRLKL